MRQRFGRLTKEQAARDELLSAYLDDQLDAGERARLEAQLAADPALRAEMEELRHTVALVREMPQQPIPRNFILPQTVVSGSRPAPAARSRRWLAPFLTAATAAVSLLFVAVLAGDLLLSSVGGVAQLAAPVSEERAALAPSPGEEDEAEKELSITELPVEEAPVEALPEPEAEGTQVPNVGVPPAPSVSPTALAETPGETKEGGDEGEQGPELTPEAEGSPVPPAAGGGGEPPTESPIPTLTSTDKAADAAASTSTPEVEEAAPFAPTPLPTTAEYSEQDLRDTEPAPDGLVETEPPSPAEGGDEDWGGAIPPVWGAPWRVIEVALGVTALLLALAMVWAWRARRR